MVVVATASVLTHSLTCPLHHHQIHHGIYIIQKIQMKRENGRCQALNCMLVGMSHQQRDLNEERKKENEVRREKKKLDVRCKRKRRDVTRLATRCDEFDRVAYMPKKKATNITATSTATKKKLFT